MTQKPKPKPTSSLLSLSLPKPVPALPKPVPTVVRVAKPEPGGGQPPGRSRHHLQQQQSRGGGNFNIGDPVNIGQQDFSGDMGMSPSTPMDTDGLFPNPPEKLRSGPSTPREETQPTSGKY